MTSSEELATAAQPLVPPNAHGQGRRRRPTGAPAPLERHIGLTGKLWLAALVVALAWTVLSMQSPTARRLNDRFDTGILGELADWRRSWLTDLARGIDRVGSGWVVPCAAVALIVALLVFRRWRHLFTFLGAMAVLQLVGAAIYDGYARPRPFGVTTIGRWAGYAMPSAPVAVATLILLSAGYALVVQGPPRQWAKVATGAVVGPFALSRLYLAVDHPLDVIVAVVLGVAIPLLGFRFFVPNEVFPVTYRRAKTAHLDVTGRRGEAIRRAVEEQLGCTIDEVRPVGLEGSGGSTPLRLRVAGDPPTYLFGKLYAMSHVRADRWYKLGRTILYGRLEDEAPFQSVRRLVEYEDYALRLLRDLAIPTATPYGIVEITPDREYLLVTEFFDGAREIGHPDVEVTTEVIDEGLRLVRSLWDAGLAHRDIKPANLLVRRGQVLLIDVFFVQVRPSPWRQAVDLANMMLVLAVRTDAAQVYERALTMFTPDEIAEAFAAARGAASPTQLRTAMKQDGRDLLAQFRALAPERRPISLQRWGIRRVVLALALAGVTAFAVVRTATLLRPATDVRLAGSPSCGTGNMLVLMAQAVPSASAVPCISALPVGWELGDVKVRQNHASFWLDSEEAGDHAVEARLSATCDVAGAIEVPSDEVGMRRYERVDELPPSLRSERTYRLEGGCVTYRLSFSGAGTASLLFAVDQALGFQPRDTLVAHVREESDQTLCGAGAPPCDDGS